MQRIGLGVLLLVNAVVLLGQVWPAGAPPFVRGVNIAFLAANLLVLATRWPATRWPAKR